MRSQRLWVVVLQRWLGGYSSSRKPRTQGFQLSLTNPVPELQRSSPRRLEKQSQHSLRQVQPTPFCNPCAYSTEIWCCTHTRENRTVSHSTGIEAISSALLLPQQKKKRVKFARTHLNHDWRMTLFTDETEFLLHSKTTSKKTTLFGRGDERTYRLWR